MQTENKPRIEVFNPVDDNDDQKTTTTILFDNNFQFLAFGTKALQRYAELIDDGDTGYLFQTVIINLYTVQNGIVSYADKREEHRQQRNASNDGNS